MIKRITHHGMVVPDIDEAIKFYTGIVGMKVNWGPRESQGGPNEGVVGYKNTHMKIAHLIAPDDAELELIQYINPAPKERPDQRERALIGATHLAFEVENVSEVYDKFIEAGGTKLMPVSHFPDGRQEAYLQDPFGNWIELDSHP